VQLAAWFTVNVWPAIVSVPERAVPVFAAAEKVVVPLPVPLAPPVIVSHETLLTAVHEQPAAVVTATGAPAPPLTGIDWLVELRLAVQLAAWFAVNVWPAIISVPERAVPELGAAEKMVVPLPVPLAPPVIVSHETLLTAVHEQPAALVTAIGKPAPPPAGID
jgi:hypothetical protein